MGIGWKCSDCDPDPRNFRVLEVEPRGDYFLVLVHYPGCVTFDGKKLLLTNADPSCFKVLDPHIGGLVIARFAPTSEGYFLARKMFL